MGALMVTMKVIIKLKAIPSGVEKNSHRVTIDEADSRNQILGWFRTLCQSREQHQQQNCKVRFN